jgi:hypothetical protein
MTPKRKVVGLMEPVPTVRSSRTRDTLQTRLEQAARMKKSKSTGDHLGRSSVMSEDIFASSSTSTIVSRAKATHDSPTKDHGTPTSRSVAMKPQTAAVPPNNPSDKVIVCVR